MGMGSSISQNLLRALLRQIEAKNFGCVSAYNADPIGAQH